MAERNRVLEKDISSNPTLLINVLKQYTIAFFVCLIDFLLLLLLILTSSLRNTDRFRIF